MRNIDKTKQDELALSRCPRVVNAETTDTDEALLRRSIVLKPWGYEYFLAGNKSAAAWILQLNPQESTSLHCHIEKKTVLIVLHGNVTVESLNNFQSHTSGETIEIAAGAFHRTRVVGNQPAYLVEVESPNRKHDLVRLEDGYGRVGSGYEKVDAFADGIANHEYFHLSELGDDQFVEKVVGQATLRLFQALTPARATEFQKSNDIVIPLQQDIQILNCESDISLNGFLPGVLLGISWNSTKTEEPNFS